MDTLRDWVISIASMLIFTAMVQMTVPSGSVKKLITMVLGLMMIMVVIKPIIKLADSEFKIEDLYPSKSSFMEESVSDKRGKGLEKRQTEQIIEVYRSKLTYRVKSIVSTIEGVELETVEFEINEDISSEEFGAVKKIYIYLSKKTESKGKAGGIKIDRIAVGTDKGESNKTGVKEGEAEGEKTGQEALYRSAAEKIREKTGSLLEVAEADIIVLFGRSGDEY